MPVLLNM